MQAASIPVSFPVLLMKVVLRALDGQGGCARQGLDQPPLEGRGLAGLAEIGAERAQHAAVAGEDRLAPGGPQPDAKRQAIVDTNGIAGANTWACWLHLIMQIMGLSM